MFRRTLAVLLLAACIAFPADLHAQGTPGVVAEQPAAASEEPYELFRGDPERAQVALTFDCGPWLEPSYLSGILDALEEYGHRVTFFVTGQFLVSHGDLFVQRIAGRHEVANHSYSHPNFTQLSAEQIQQELAWTEELASLYGVSTRGVWRAPFGSRDARVLQVAAGEGYPLHVMWSHDSGDWRPELSPERVRSRILEGSVNGGIIVMHCNSWQTSQVLSSVLWHLREWGIAVVPVGDIVPR